MATSEPMTAPSDATTDLVAIFSLLSDETRLAIVRELAACRLGESEPRLSFSALRTRVGIDDAGRFNYHLGRLRGSLVEKGEDGYGLTETGAVVGSMLVESPPESVA